MPLGLRDLAAFAVPPADQTTGQDSLHRFAGGLREMAQLGQQRDLEEQRLQQQAVLQNQRIAADKAAARQRAVMERQEAERRTAESRRVGAQRAFGEFSQLLHQPGGAARAESQLPALQAHGVTWQALPDGSYGFVYQPGGGQAEQWGKLDLNKMSVEDRAATERMLGAAVRAQTGRTPTDVAAAGKDAVLADPSLAGKEALDAFAGATNPQLNRQQSAENARRNAAALATRENARKVGSGGMGPVDPKVMNYAAQRQQQLVRDRQMQMRPLRSNIALARQALAEMSSGNPLAQNTALISRLKAAFGSRSTDKELAFVLSEGGLAVQLQNAFARAADGTLSDEYRGAFMEATQRMLELDSSRLTKEARAIDELVRTDPAIVAYVGQDYADLFGRRASEQVLGGGMGPDEPPAPAGDDDADAEFDALMGGP